MIDTLLFWMAIGTIGATSFFVFRFITGKVVADIQGIVASAEKIKQTRFIDFVIHAFVTKSKLTIVVKLISCLFFFWVAKSVLSAKSWVFAIPVGIVGFCLPGFLVKRSIQNKLNKFEEQLVDSLGIIANSVRVGASLMQSIEVLVKNSQPPLSLEFGEVTRQVKLGIPLSDALEEMTQRVPSKNLAFMVMAITATQEYGGNLSEVLLRIASVMREKTRVQGKIDTLTAQGKITGMMVTALPFILLLVLNLMEPMIFGTLFTHPIGQIALVVAIIMVMIGNFVIRKIVTIDL